MKIWKNILLGWLCLLLTSVAVGQELTQAEYFIDEDTGPGNGTAIAITTGASLDESFTFSTAGLAVGNHTIYIRTKQAGDRWSIDRALYFYVQDTVQNIAFSETRLIVAAEYFVDTDPVAGNGTAIPVSTSGLVEESFTVSTDGLAVGEHKLFVRTQDDSGVWSLTDAMDLYIQDTVQFVPKVETRFIVAAEYFIDTDPNIGNGTAIPLTIAGEISDVFSANTAGLALGAHKLYIRTQDNAGLWSLTKDFAFAVLPTTANIPIPYFSADTVASNAVMTFTNLSDSVDASTTYKWDILDDGTIDYSTEHITHTFIGSGLYSVRLTAYNGADSASYVGKVLVGDFSDLAITASSATDLCEGEEVTFTAPAGYTYYAWNTGDSTQSITVAEQGKFFAWLTDADGFTVKSEIVTVNVTPTFIATIDTQDATIGQSNGFAEVIIDTEDVSYQWSSSMSTDSYLNGLAAGSYSVTVSNAQCTEVLPFTILEVTPVASDLVAAEYFFDTDPGAGQAAVLNISSGQEVSFAEEISTVGLVLGSHTLYVRTRDNEGFWSLTNQMSVFIQDTVTDESINQNRLIVAAEYFFDTDLGIGSGNTISVPSPVASISNNLNIDVSGLTTGDHTLYLRTQSDDGIWSLAQAMDFQNCATAVDVPLADNITACPTDNVVLTATGAVGNTFMWFRADSTLIENQTAATYTVGTVAEDEIYYVAQKDANGCRSPLTEILITAPQFEVFAGVDFEISNAGNDYTVSAFYPENGTWTGSGISELGIINRASVGVSDYIYTYTVDDSGCSFSDARTLSVLDLKEVYAISLAENQPSNTTLQQIIAEEVLSYDLTVGEATAIAIGASGLVSIADSAYFDFEVNPNPSWTILANQSEEFTYQVNLNLALTDAPDLPIIENQTFSIDENSPLKSFVGTIVTTDKDTPILIYTIESGNESGAFTLSNANELAIADSALFDFEVNESFELVISVNDGTSTVSATISVTVNNLPELPIITSESNANVCQDDVFTYTSTGTNLNWYSDVNLSGLVASGESYLPATDVLGDFTFYVAETVDGNIGAAAVVTLSVNEIYNEVADATICEGEIYVFGSQNLTLGGAFTEVFQSLAGCDSTVVLTLTVNPSYDLTADATICTGDTYVFGTQNLTTAGIFSETFQTLLGCDSIVALTLAVVDSFNETADDSFCDGDTYAFGTQNLTIAGTYTELFTSSTGCDSTVVLILSVAPTFNETASATICEGETYEFGSLGLLVAGDYTEVLQSQVGCDSTVTLSLVVNPIFNEAINAEFCEGDTYVFGTQSLITEGSFSELFTSTLGCDSTVALTLSFAPTYNESVNASFCDGDIYVFGTQNLTLAGSYTELFQSSIGCDSTVNLSLSVAPTFNETASAAICDGDTYTFGTQSLTTGGNFTETFQSVIGCDSTVVLTLAINDSFNETANENICDGDTYIFGTQTLTNSGEFTEVFQSALGCDSTVVLTLAVTTMESVITESNGILSVDELGALYQWIDCNNGNVEIAGATDRNFEPTEDGSYAVVITKDDCESTSECFDFSTVLGIVENDISESIQVYPNPTKDKVSVDFGDTYVEGTYEVINISGKVVLRGNINHQKSVQFDIKGDNGVYLLKITDKDGKNALLRIVKM